MPFYTHTVGISEGYPLIQCMNFSYVNPSICNYLTDVKRPFENNLYKHKCRKNNQQRNGKVLIIIYF